jgi:hypothetical protein
MYYLLERDSFQKPRPYRTRSLVDDDRFEPSAWITGNLMEMPDQPIRVELWARAGNGMSELFLDSIPLFREDLISTLESAGVDNLQTCPAILQAPDDPAITNYRAVNIVGRIACADMTKSQFDDITGTGMIAVGFRKLVIDEAAVGGQLFFRLAQSVASIVVHESVKRAVDQVAFRYLSWRPLVE